MKLLSRICLPVFACLLLMTACQKENLVDNGETITTEEPEVIETNPLASRTLPSGDGIDLGCFSIDLPFQMVNDEGTVYTINEVEDLENIEAQGITLVDFVYPLNVTMEDGEAVAVNNVEELAELFAECLPDGGWEEGDFPAYLINFETSCYTLQYPIDLQDVNGDVITAENEAEFTGAISEEIYFFVFPITLIDEEGNAVEVNNNDEIFEALLACNEYEPGDSSWDWETGFEYLGCYMIEFPMDVVLTDGTTVTVENHEQLCDLMLTGELAGYAFPLTLIDEEGNEVLVESNEELGELLEECWDIPTEIEGIFFLATLFEGEQSCYTINYPITLELEGEDDVTINSIEDLDEFFSTNPNTSFTVQVPVTVTLLSNGDDVELETLEDIWELQAGC